MSESSFYPSSKMFLDPKVPLMRAQRIASVLESASSLSPSEFIALNRCMDHAEAILDRVPTTRVRDRTSHTTDPEGSAIVDRRGMSTVDSTSQISTQPDESTSDQPLGKRIRAEIIQADLSQTEAAHTKVLGETRVLTDHLAGLVSELRMREEEARHIHELLALDLQSASEEIATLEEENKRIESQLRSSIRYLATRHNSLALRLSKLRPLRGETEHDSQKTTEILTDSASASKRECSKSIQSPSIRPEQSQTMHSSQGVYQDSCHVEDADNNQSQALNTEHDDATTTAQDGQPSKSRTSSRERAIFNLERRSSAWWSDFQDVARKVGIETEEEVVTLPRPSMRERMASTKSKEGGVWLEAGTDEAGSE